MNEHQREIVAQLWGLYSGKPKSKKEVAEDMGVTYNRIRQVERSRQDLCANLFAGSG